MVFSVLLPFLIGCGIAFVLNIPMRGIEQGIFFYLFIVCLISAPPLIRTRISLAERTVTRSTI